MQSDQCLTSQIPDSLTTNNEYYQNASSLNRDFYLIVLKKTYEERETDFLMEVGSPIQKKQVQQLTLF